MKKSLVLIITVLLFSLVLSSCGENTEVIKEADFSEVSSICELATLKCYYHNSFEMKTESTGFLSIIGNYGFKKAWIEYSGIVNVGVDASQIEVIPPEEGSNIVKIYLPEAKILSVTFDSDSISEPITETGWFTEISAEELTKAQGKAQDDMQAKAEKDESLKKQAYERAKSIIKAYVQNLGSLMGVEYKVEWIEK